MAIVEKPLLSRPTDYLTRRPEEQQSVIGSISRYTRFVLFSKMFLACLSLLMIFGIVIIPLFNADEEGLRLAFSTVQEKQGALPVMTNPTFQGVDEKNQPYFVTADSALQQDENIIVLENVQGDMLSEGNNWLSVKAASGTIDNVAETMKLTEDVRLYHQDGYEFRTGYVLIDMNARKARGDQPVKGFGPMGEIDASGFSWDHDARVLKFLNKVNMTMMPKP